MRKIKLTKNRYALVDDEDFEWLNQWKWHFTHGYARRDEGRKKIYMHRQILGFPSEGIVDHINQNKLDNRRKNMRVTTHGINHINRGLPSNNTSGYLGVTWDRNHNKWLAQIKKSGKNHNLGYYSSIKDAAQARRIGEHEYFGI